jgi:hypothetical protein
VGAAAAIAQIIVYYAAQVVPAEILGQVEILVVAGVAAGLGYLGKRLRDAGYRKVPV